MDPGRLALERSPTMTGGAFAIPTGKDMPGPVSPGEAYEFTVVSGNTGRLSFATMYVQSNDLFYSPDQIGIQLFDSLGEPLSGDITNLLQLWDAGTEANEIPGIGVNQAPRQSGPNTGPADPDSTVRLVNDSFEYPDIDQVLQVTITPLESSPFTVRVENLSESNALPVSETDSVSIPLSPGLWVVHTTEAPLYSNGESDRGFGLEAIAEDGNPAPLAEWFSTKMGSPHGVFYTPKKATDPAVITPGESYEFSFEAAPGAYLSLVTMFVESNDLIYLPDEAGIQLFDEDDMPVSADVTSHFNLWDAGTELNEQPGVGENQPPRQGGMNLGPQDTLVSVRIADDQYFYPPKEQVIRVTINRETTSVTSLTKKLSHDISVKTFPNPLGDEATIQVKLKESAVIGIEVISLDGRRIASIAKPQFRSAESHQYTYRPKKNLGTGIYMVRVFNKRGTLATSLMIKR